MNTNISQNDSSVIVIGAGAAGLAAGRRLNRAGFDAIVLEARDRVGGRLWTSYDMAPHPVELGGEWILGNEAISWSLMKEFGLHGLAETDFDLYSAYINGQLLDAQAFFNIEQAKDMFPLAEASDAMQVWQDAGRPDGSLAEILDAANMEKEMLALYRNRITLDYAAQPEQLGVYGLLEADNASYGEGYFRVEEGYSQLMAGLAEGQDIKLNSAVNRIVWNDIGVAVHTRAGEVFTAAHAIITLPLAVLQARDVSFEPALPAAKLTAINGLGSGKVTKLILKFKEKFWTEPMDGVWTTLDSQTWYRPGMHRHNEAPILTGYMGGDAAERFTALGEAGAIAEGLRQLEKMFGMDNLGGQLDGAKFVVWAEQEFSKMAYSYVPVGGAGLRDGLAAAVGRVLFFAGEATNRECASLVHGALQSGNRAADEVCGYLSNR